MSISEKHKKLIKNLVITIVVLGLVLLFFTKLLKYIGPFIIAIIVTSLLEKPIRLMQKKLGFKRGIAVAISLFVFVIVVGGILGVITYQITKELWSLIPTMPSAQEIQGYIDSFAQGREKIYNMLPKDLADDIFIQIEENMGSVTSGVTAYLKTLLNSIIGIAQSLPSVFIFVLVSIVATFFLSRDREKIANYIYGLLSENMQFKAKKVTNELIYSLFRFVGAELTVSSLMFVMLLAGYLIMGVKYAVFFALVTAIVDLLPILGTGTVLIPSSIILAIFGNYMLAIGFFLLYIVIIVVRQFVEPRIVGGSLGLHPLLTLMSMYVGLKLLGVSGLFLGPIMVLVYKTFQGARVLPEIDLK